MNKRKEYQKKYREEHKDEIKRKKKEYNIRNKERISIYNKKYGNEKINRKSKSFFLKIFGN